MTDPAPPDLTSFKFRARDAAAAQHAWTPLSLFLTIAGGVATGILAASLVLFIAAMMLLDAAAEETARQLEALTADMQRQMATATRATTRTRTAQARRDVYSNVSLPPPNTQAKVGSLACADGTVVQREENGWTQLRRNLLPVMCDAGG